MTAAEEVVPQDGNQRKRRGRIGNNDNERVGAAADNAAPAAMNGVHDQADVLDDAQENDRSKGEMLMECVVKVCMISHPRQASSCSWIG